MDELKQYRNCLYEIQRRIMVIEDHLNERYVEKYLICEVEFICLQYRKILENIAFSSLCANIEQYKGVREKYYNDWNAKKILDAIEKINKDFYPKPVVRKWIGKSKYNSDMYNLEEYKGTYLNREKFIEVYDECSNFLHESNPFSERMDIKKMKKKFEIWLSEIKCLLNHHVTRVNNVLIIGLLDTDIEYPKVYLFLNQEDFDKRESMDE